MEGGDRGPALIEAEGHRKERGMKDNDKGQGQAQAQAQAQALE